jgi:hypothetical protein
MSVEPISEIANLYRQACNEQKGLATFFLADDANLGKILIGLMGVAYSDVRLLYKDISIRNGRAL